MFSLQNFQSKYRRVFKIKKKSYIEKYYKRPPDVPFPKIFHNFRLRNKFSNKIIHYRIQDIPFGYFESALDMIEDNFVPNDALAIGKKLHQKEEARFVLRCYLRRILYKKFSLGCFVNDGSDEFIGTMIFDFHTLDKHDPIVVS